MLCRKNKQIPNDLRKRCFAAIAERSDLFHFFLKEQGASPEVSQAAINRVIRTVHRTSVHSAVKDASLAWPQEKWGFHAASFRLLIRVRAEVDGCGVLWALSSPSKKLISPPTRMTKPER
jgi:hypothetical protein